MFLGSTGCQSSLTVQDIVNLVLELPCWNPGSQLDPGVDSWPEAVVEDEENIDKVEPMIRISGQCSS